MLSIDSALNALSALVPVEKPQRMPLLHPRTSEPLYDADGKAAYVDVFSTDSEIARQHERAMVARRLRMRRGQNITAAENAAEQTDLLVALTHDWYVVMPNGEPLGLDFTPDAARRIYDHPAGRWIRQQVDEFAADRANFMQDSSSTSLNGPKPSSGKTAKP